VGFPIGAFVLWLTGFETRKDVQHMLDINEVLRSFQGLSI